MTRKLFISLSITPIIYFLIALILALVPVKRDLPVESLDFRVLNIEQISEHTAIEKYYVPRDGNELFYRYLPGNTKMILVLLHGSGTEGRYLIPLAKKLSSTVGVHVIIPDLRGHGRSALSNMGDIDYLGQYEHDLEDFNSYLKSEYPDSRIIIGGHSSGGGLAVKYGGGEHIQFDGYLLLAPYLGYQATTVRPNSGGWVQVSTRRYAGIAMLNNVGITLLNSLPVLFFNRPPEWTDSLQADSYSYRLNESFSPQVFSENLKKNKKPILVLIGSDDEAFYAKEFEAVFSQYAPHAEVKLIAGAKHLNLPNSETALDSIRKWLAVSMNDKALQEAHR